MIKKIIGLLTLLIVVGVAVLFFYLDALVTRGIEVVGTRVLGTSVSVNSVLLSPLNGSGNISDLRIENPEGYSADYIFELGYVSMNIDVQSVFSDVLVIESVTIAQPVITYETRITSDNVRALLQNLPASDAADQPASGTSAGKQIIIRELQILNPQLNLSAGTISAPVQLPDIILHDIGTTNDAATVAEALRVVLSALRTTILRADLPSIELLRDSIENTVQDSVEQAGQAIDSAVENLGNRLRNLGNQ